MTEKAPALNLARHRARLAIVVLARLASVTIPTKSRGGFRHVTLLVPTRVPLAGVLACVDSCVSILIVFRVSTYVDSPANLVLPTLVHDSLELVQSDSGHTG